MRTPSSERFSFDLRARADQDGRAEAQGMKLASGLKHARFGSLGEDDPFGVPLQFFDDATNETHGA
jgi:hypothetical protein